MDPAPTTDGEPPAPGRVRLRDRWRMAWHGRRDAKPGLPIDAEVSRPYLASIRADAEAGQRAVTAWLHEQIAPIDREAVGVLTRLDQYRRNPPTPPTPTATRPADADPRPATTIPTWVLEARRVAAAQAEYERQLRERDSAEQRLAELGSTRRHLIEIARAAARAHISRYDQLAGLYGAAFLRHHPNWDGNETGSRPPAMVIEPWIKGPLPLLALEIDTELTESYRWVLREFEIYTASPERPIPEEISAQRAPWPSPRK